MRIQRLKIADYGNLQNFEIFPENGKQTTVLLGRNGSGKSNLIEVIVEVFRDLEAGGSSAFYYELDYEIRGYGVAITNNPLASPRQQITVDGNKISKSAYSDQKDAYLPKYVFSYYSGWNKRLEALFHKPTNELYKAWKEGGASENIPLRRLFYCRKDYSQLVLLAFFLMDSKPEIKDFLEKYLKIENFESALFVMHKPYWRGTKRPSKDDIAHGDSIFWYAKGAFLNFTDRLWRHSLAPIRNDETVTKDFRGRTEDQERLYLFIKDRETLKELIYPGEDETHFFAHLEGLYLCDLIDEVRVTVQHTHAGKIRFEQLSEGEQQLLTVLGLLHFTKGEESLFLLDEPDTHLNPSWTYEYLNLLENQVVNKTSQMFIATHNPLMIGGLKKEQVRLLSKAETSDIYKTKAEMPDDDPIGMGVDGLLQSEIYGMQSVLAPAIVEKIHLRQKLLAAHRQSRKVQKEIQKLSDELAEMGVAVSHPHPYFDQFAKALARKDLLSRPSLSPEEIKELENVADEILKEQMKGSK
jgi:predicted ATPase